MAKKVLFISSMGGHLSELRQLEPMFQDYEYMLITEKNETTANLYKQYHGHVRYLAYETKLHLFRYLFVFSWNILKSFGLFFKFRPDCVITTGTHTAVPMCYIAKCFRKKVIWIETFANRTTKTAAGKMVYPIADVFIVQWKELLAEYPNAIYGGWIY